MVNANEPWKQVDSLESFDVEEVTDTSDETENIVHGGAVEDWKTLEFAEKVKVRPYITGVVLSTWAIAIVASVIRLLITGNFLLAVPPVLISVPLYIVLKYYFSSG